MNIRYFHCGVQNNMSRKMGDSKSGQNTLYITETKQKCQEEREMVGNSNMRGSGSHTVPRVRGLEPSYGEQNIWIYLTYSLDPTLL